MRTTKWTYRICNLLIAATFTGILWWFFGGMVHDAFFLVPFFWLMHVRSLHRKLADLDERLKLQADLIAAVLNDEEAYESYGDMLDKHGFTEESDALDELDKR